MKSNALKGTIGVLGALTLPVAAVAAVELTTFEDGDVVSAGAINANFSALNEELESLRAEVESLKSQPTFAVGESDNFTSVAAGTTTLFQLNGEGLIYARPQGSGLGDVQSSIEFCSTPDDCRTGPRALTNGQPLTFAVATSQYFRLTVNGGGDSSTVGLYWTPLTSAASEAPTIQE